MRYFKGRKAIFVLVAALAVVFTGAGVAVGAATAKAPTTKSGTTVSRTVITTENANSAYSSASWTSVRAISIYSPSGRFIVARWTAESNCYGTGSSSSNWCSARILVDGVEADPVAGTNFSFNSVESPNSWESLSMERTRNVTFTGSHTVRLQLASVGTANHFIDDWTLTAQVISRS